MAQLGTIDVFLPRVLLRRPHYSEDLIKMTDIMGYIKLRLTGCSISIRIKNIVKMLSWKMTKNLLIGRVTKIWRQTSTTVTKARAAMKVKHCSTQVITSLTSHDARCVILRNWSFGERRELSVRRRNIKWFVKALLAFAGRIL